MPWNEVISRKHVSNSLEAMEKRGRISSNQRESFEKKLSNKGEVKASKVFSLANKHLKKNTELFKEYLGEESGNFFPAKAGLRKKIAAKLGKSDFRQAHEILLFADPYSSADSLLRRHPNPVLIAEKIHEAVNNAGGSDNHKSNFLYYLTEHLNNFKPAHVEERLDQVNAFLNNGEAHKQLAEEALKTGYLHSVDYFIKKTNAAQANADKLKDVLHICKKPVDVRKVADEIADVPLERKEVLDFVRLSAKSNKVNNAEEFTKRISELRKFLEADDKTRHLVEHGKNIADHFDFDGDYSSINVARILFKLDNNAARLFGEEELNNIKDHKTLFDELEKRIERKKEILQDAEKLEEGEKTDFVLLANHPQVLSAPIKFTAERFLKILELRKNFGSAKTDLEHEIDEHAISDKGFHSAITVPLLHASPDEKSFEENLNILREIEKSKGVIAGQMIMVLNEQGESHNGLAITKHETDWPTKVMKFVIGWHYYEKLKSVYEEELKKNGVELNKHDFNGPQNFFYTEHPKMSIMPKLIDCPNQRHAFRIMKRAMKAIVGQKIGDDRILNNALDLVGKNGFKDKDEFVQKMIGALPKELDDASRQRLAKEIDNISWGLKEESEE